MLALLTSPSGVTGTVVVVVVVAAVVVVVLVVVPAVVPSAPAVVPVVLVVKVVTTGKVGTGLERGSSLAQAVTQRHKPTATAKSQNLLVFTTNSNYNHLRPPNHQSLN